MLQHIPQTERDNPERIIWHDCVDFSTSHVAEAISQVYTSSSCSDFKKSSCETYVTWTEDYSCLKPPFSPDISAELLLSTWQRHLWCLLTVLIYHTHIELLLVKFSWGWEWVFTLFWISRNVLRDKLLVRGWVLDTWKLRCAEGMNPADFDIYCVLNI